MSRILQNLNTDLHEFIRSILLILSKPGRFNLCFLLLSRRELKGGNEVRYLDWCGATAEARRFVLYARALDENRGR
jgi:hypothetical protein